MRTVLPTKSSETMLTCASAHPIRPWKDETRTTTGFSCMLSETVSIIEKDLPNNAPIADVTTLPLQTFLPLVGECSQLNEEFILIARVIVEKRDYFHA